MARAYTVATLAEAWECSEGVIRKLIADERLKSFRIGNLIRIPAAEVERFECQNIPSNDFEAGLPSSTQTQLQANEPASGYMRPTGQERRRKLGKAGGAGTPPLGRLAG